MVIQFKDYLRNNKWLIPFLAILLLICSSVSIYASGLWSLPVIGGSGTYVVGGTTPSIFIIGTFDSLTPVQQQSYPVFVLLPIEAAVIGIIALIMRIKMAGSMKGIILIAAIAIFSIIAFLIIQNFVSLLGLSQ
jgi:hypothetical protein